MKMVARTASTLARIAYRVKNYSDEAIVIIMEDIGLGPALRDDANRRGAAEWWPVAQQYC